MSPASSQTSFIQIGQHGDSEQGPDEAQAMLITNLQKENSPCFHLLLRKQATALYFPTATPKQVAVAARRCPAAFLGTLPGRAVASRRRGPILPPPYPHQTHNDPLLPNSSASCTPDSFRGVSQVQSPGSRQKSRRHAPPGQPGGEGDGRTPAKPRRRARAIRSPHDRTRSVQSPAAPSPSLFPSRHPTPATAVLGAGRKGPPDRALPSRALRAVSRSRRRSQREAPAAAARAPSRASMTAGPRRQSRPCAGGGAAPPRPIRATPSAPGGGTTPPLEGAVWAARGRRGAAARR